MYIDLGSNEIFCKLIGYETSSKPGTVFSKAIESFERVFVEFEEKIIKFIYESFQKNLKTYSK